MLLEVKKLNVNFKEDRKIVKAVCDIDFNINENEIVGLVGESGSGKTVTALSVMRLLEEKVSDVTGHVTFLGKDVLSLSRKEMLDIRGSKIAMIFQEPFTSLNPVLRVGEQIKEAILSHRKIQEEDAKIESLDLLKKIRISAPERIYNSYPHLLSGGERQRIMIAMAIALQPKLLIADEPTTALDVTIQSEILDLILELKRELEMSVLFITHDFAIVKKMADRVLVMKEGKIIESAKKDEILSSPREDYTKKLLEAVPKIELGVAQENKEKGKPIIKIKDLSKTFAGEKGILKHVSKHVKAVQNVSFEIEEGKTLGLVGESGSGKTTLGKLLMGLLKPDNGIILGDDYLTSTQIVFQDPYSSLDPRMKMRDIVLEGPTIKGIPKREKEEILENVLFKVRLKYQNRFKYPHQFSGGERQRISIARALAVKPKILILDEPVSSLDVIIQAGILDLLKELQKELSLTFVFISHDLRIVEKMSDYVAVMLEGKIVEFGTKYEIYYSPKHPYTKNLIKSVLL